jgi:hypothetical protein
MFGTVIGAMRGSGRVPARVVVDGVRLGSHTQIRRVTPALLICESVVPGVGVELRSAYVSRGGRGRVEDLALAPAQCDVESVVRDRDSLLVPSERRHCLLDHLLRFHELLEESGYVARIDVLSLVDRFRHLFGRSRARR